MKSSVKFGLFTTLIVVFASLFASSFPDGLESISKKLGFLNQAASGSALMKNYSISFLGQGALSTVIAGLIGIAVIMSMFALFTKVLTSAKSASKG